MSSETLPKTPAAFSKLPLVMGFVCFVIGAVTLLYAGFTALKSMDQTTQAQRNLQQLETSWPRIANNNQQTFEVMKGLATSTILLARTNYRVKLALGGVSLLTMAAGGALLFSARPRK